MNKLRAGLLGTILSLSVIGNFTVGEIVSLSAVTAIPIATGAATCSKDQLAASAQDVLDVVTSQALASYLQTVSPSALARLLSLAPSARSLVVAIKTGDVTTAIGLVNIIGPAIDDIAQALKANQKQLAYIGLANLALHFIVNHVKVELPAARAVSASAATAIAYASRPAWGCEYHKNDKRCR